MSLLETVRRHVAPDSVAETPVPGLMLMRSSQSHMPRHVAYKPSLCVVLEGAKQVMLGDEGLDYGPGHTLVVNVELPLVSQVTQAPYTGLSLGFDIALMREVLGQLDRPPAAGEGGAGLLVGSFSGGLEDAVARLAGLLDQPQAVAVLAPGITREIYYWLLTGPYGGDIARLALPDGHMQRIAEAIGIMRDDFARPIRVEELASAARMSPSSFHQHFKTLTAMTPLQYQKQLRLLEARRLMLGGSANVANAAYRVGYESVSQFSREYARLFGTPPKRHVAELRAAPMAVV